MKKIFIIFSIFIFYKGLSQTQLSACCTPMATEKYALNATDEQFINAHLEPLPFTYTGSGQDISYPAAGGTDAHAWEIKAKKPTNYYLFVIHEWWGLNEYIKKESEQLANDLGINVIALDLYDKQVATTRDDASKMMQSVKTDRAMAIIKGLYTYVGSNAKIFTVGWCFGGGWSLQTSIEGGKQSVGCIMYYGQPEKDVNRLKKLNCDLLGFFANKDQWINPTVVSEFRENLKAAGIRANIHQYDADHGFANPSNPIYDKTATTDAHNKALVFVKERLK